MSENRFSEYIKPTAVLVVICLVVTLVLAATYAATKPVIDENNALRADAARAEVLPEGAGGFSERELGDSPVEGVLEAYQADNGRGMVFTVEERGFGGSLTVMVGIDAEGGVTGVEVTGHSETPGLGTKAMTAEYLFQYIGQKAVSLTGGGDAARIDTVTGATISSEAVFRAVELALRQYAEMGGI
ncbi:MAG: RnfABCDGE type electron transport complex subunit G [Bacillota bacterium]|nr:RnfABCDGE type electron transport complex subunit G [Bacillota bacterium]